MKHGGDLTEAMARYGGELRQWLDLSTGINPWPWPVGEIPAVAWQRLPGKAEEAALMNAARHAYRVPDSIDCVAAPGTQALIQWLPRLAPASPVAIFGPTYSEHASAWRHAGHEVLEASDDLPANARHAVIVNPNNPDGRVVSPAKLADWAAQLRDRGGWLIIDEAFGDVVPDSSAVELCRELPIIVLKSFGKFYGLAGLRLGFALAAPHLAKVIAQAIGPWSCSGPALEIGKQALNDQAWADQTRQRLRAQATRLDVVLDAAGFDLIGGTSLYRLVRCRDARAVHKALARQHIWCRRFDWADDRLRFGLPDDAGLQQLTTALALG